MNIHGNQIDKLKVLKFETEEIISLVSEMNLTLKKNAFIPIQDNLAYFIGDIKNTNQCKVYLGEDYFLETTNHRAIKILKNRVDRIENIIKISESSISESSQLNSNINKDENIIEIKEDLTEEEYYKLKRVNIEESETININLQDKLKKIKEMRNSTDNEINTSVKRKVRDKINIDFGFDINKVENINKRSLFLLNDEM